MKLHYSLVFCAFMISGIIFAAHSQEELFCVPFVLEPMEKPATYAKIKVPAPLATFYNEQTSFIAKHKEKIMLITASIAFASLFLYLQKDPVNKP